MREELKKYHARMNKEAIWKSVFYGALIGFAVMLAIALPFYFFDVGYVWLPPVAFVVVTVGCSALFYFLKLRPTEETIARRLDSFGLEERMITMNEFKEEDSYIARRQREDAQQALESLDASMLKFKLSTAFIVALSIVGVLSMSACTVNVLADAGIIASGRNIWDKATTVPVQYTIRYGVQEYNADAGRYIIDKNERTGSVLGADEQTFEEGDEIFEVMAMAEDEYVFIGWSDGNEDPYRLDLDIVTQMKKEGVTEKTIYAIFQKVQYGDGSGEGEGEGEPGEGEGEGEGEGKPGEPGTGEGEEAGDQESDQDSDSAGGSYDTDSNKVYNGKTDYSGEYDSRRDGSSDRMNNSDNVSDDQRGVAEGYWDIINSNNGG